MDFNAFLFPSPDLKDDFYKKMEEVIFIPRQSRREGVHTSLENGSTGSYNFNNTISNNKSSKLAFIPAMFLKSIFDSSNILIFFHGNAEDIFLAYQLAEEIKLRLNFNILLVEYPGYSIYNADKDSDTMLENSLIVYDFLVDELDANPNNIYTLGRSIGTASALFLASKRKLAGVILISPFTSIRGVAESMVGMLFKYLVNERFENIEYIKSVYCPILFIHGMKDQLIPFTHTIALKDSCKCPYEAIFPDNMNHNDLNVRKDLTEPMEKFLAKHTDYTFENEVTVDYSIPNEFKELPDYLLESFPKLRKEGTAMTSCFG